MRKKEDYTVIKNFTKLKWHLKKVQEEWVKHKGKHFSLIEKKVNSNQ